MTQHKVLSDDSMTAMDEIARVLGQDAVILSTKKMGEKIEIIGSNDIKDVLKSNKKNHKKTNFKELFSKVPLSENKINPIIKKIPPKYSRGKIKFKKIAIKHNANNP